MRSSILRSPATAATGPIELVHDVPGLLVHDSVIIPASKEGLARDVLERNFERVIGVKPVLKVK